MKLYGKKDENELLNNFRTGAGHPFLQIKH